ncbi:hypothetical protein F5878DRAFT_712944 [Lentinula raphanica]|uniref:Uncharacterized protein n=1 Tax=Lentinula raphanica TaxID=153919 RepID=A0AA38P0D6_9AGAR|nr:hypothetical protein F5878DRAFT_712944 [Lentinula raphanica]
MAKAPKKKKEKKDFPTVSWTENNRARSHALLTEIEREENRVVFLGKRKGSNTSGDTKTKAGKRIAAKVIPDIYAIDPVAASKRCVDHWDGLVKKYKEHAKRLRKTGEGVLERDEKDEVDEDTQEKDEYLESYVGPQGPDETTSERIRNIWDEILNEFPLFPRLHTLLSTRANITPPQITTGVGPAGRTVLHLQIEEDQNRSAVDLTAMPSDPGTPPRPSSPPLILDPRLEDQPISAAPRPSTFGSLKNSSMESTPIATTSYGQAAASSSSALESAVSRARNSSSRPPKRTVEDRLFDIQDKTLKNMKRVKREAFSQSSRELALKERDQVIQLANLGIISPATAKQKLDTIDSYANAPILDSSPPSSPTRG